MAGTETPSKTSSTEVYGPDNPYDAYGNPKKYKLATKLCIRAEKVLEKISGYFLRYASGKAKALYDNAFPQMPITSWGEKSYGFPTAAGKYVGSSLEDIPPTDPVTIPDPPVETADSEGPTVTFTLPASSSTFDVVPQTFTATDTSGVLGYMITYTNDTPEKTSTGWYPSTYTRFPLDSSKAVEHWHTTSDSKDIAHYRFEIYGWAMDVKGNISAGALGMTEVFGEDGTIPVGKALDAPPAQALPRIEDFTFTAETSSSFKVKIKTLVGTGYLPVTKYMIVESATPAPYSNDPRWKTVPAKTNPVTPYQSSYTFLDATEGLKTAYAWAMDAGNRVSLNPTLARITVNLVGVPTLAGVEEVPGSISDPWGSTVANTYIYTKGASGRGVNDLTPVVSFWTNYSLYQLHKTWDKGETVHAMYVTPKEWYQEVDGRFNGHYRVKMNTRRIPYNSPNSSGYPTIIEFPRTPVYCDKGRVVLMNSFSELDLRVGVPKRSERHNGEMVKGQGWYWHHDADYAASAHKAPPGRPVNHGHLFHSDGETGTYIGNDTILYAFEFVVTLHWTKVQNPTNYGYSVEPNVHDGEVCDPSQWTPPPSHTPSDTLGDLGTGMWAIVTESTFLTMGFERVTHVQPPTLGVNTSDGSLVNIPPGMKLWSLRSASFGLIDDGSTIGYMPDSPVTNSTDDMIEFVESSSNEVKAELLARGRRPAMPSSVHTAGYVGANVGPNYQYRVNYIIWPANSEYNRPYFGYATEIVFMNMNGYVSVSGIYNEEVVTGGGTRGIHYQAICTATLPEGKTGYADLVIKDVVSLEPLGVEHWATSKHAFTHPTLGIKAAKIFLKEYLGLGVVVGSAISQSADPAYYGANDYYFPWGSGGGGGVQGNTYGNMGVFSSDSGATWHKITPPAGLTDNDIHGATIVKFDGQGHGLSVINEKLYLYSGGTLALCTFSGFDSAGKKVDLQTKIMGVASPTNSTKQEAVIISRVSGSSGNISWRFKSSSKTKIKTHGPKISSVASITCLNGKNKAWVPGTITISTDARANEITVQNALPVENCVVKITYQTAASDRLLAISYFNQFVRDAGWLGVTATTNLFTGFTFTGGGLTEYLGDTVLPEIPIPESIAELKITSSPTFEKYFIYSTTGTVQFVPIDVEGGVFPYDFEQTDGTLPPGMELDEGGNVYGIPYAPGGYTFTVKVTDQQPLSVSKTFTLTVV